MPKSFYMTITCFALLMPISLGAVGCGSGAPAVDQDEIAEDEPASPELTPEEEEAEGELVN